MGRGMEVTFNLREVQFSEEAKATALYYNNTRSPAGSQLNENLTRRER